MKRLFTIIALLYVSLFSSFAQDRVHMTGDEVKYLIEKITAAHEGIQTISSDFVQKKTSVMFSEDMVQKGCFKYVSPDSLVWEYTWPVAMSFDMGDGANKMSLMLKDMIVNTITGATITDAKNFSAKYFHNADNTISVVLTPLSKRLQKMYKELCIVLDGNTFYATSVSFIETNDDKTVITFTNQEVKK